MNKFIILALLIFGASQTMRAQTIVKGSGILYTSGVPTHVVNTQSESEFAIDTVSGFWYEYNRDSLTWKMAGFRVQHIPILSAPTYTPTDKQSLLVVNSVDSLYFYRAGGWRHVNNSDGYKIIKYNGTAVARRSVANFVGSDAIGLLISDNAGQTDIQPYINSGSITSAMITNETVTGADIATATILAGNIGQNGAAIGQVLKWNGTAWVAANDSTLSGSTAGGDLSGTYPNPTVAKIQGQTVSATVPTTGQVLKFSGGQWGPAADGSATVSDGIINDAGTLKIGGAYNSGRYLTGTGSLNFRNSDFDYSAMLNRINLALFDSTDGTTFALGRYLAGGQIAGYGTSGLRGAAKNYSTLMEADFDLDFETSSQQMRTRFYRPSSGTRYWQFYSAETSSTSTSGQDNFSIIRRTKTPSVGPRLNLIKERTGTFLTSTPTYIPSGERLGSIFFMGSQTESQRSAAIYTQTTGAHSATSQPAKMVFATTPTSTTAPVDRMTLDENGDVTMHNYTSTRLDTNTIYGAAGFDANGRLIRVAGGGGGGGGADGNGIYDGSGTVPAGTVATVADSLIFVNDSLVSIQISPSRIEILGRGRNGELGTEFSDYGNQAKIQVYDDGNGGKISFSNSINDTISGDYISRSAFIQMDDGVFQFGSESATGNIGYAYALVEGSLFEMGAQNEDDGLGTIILGNPQNFSFQSFNSNTAAESEISIYPDSVSIKSGMAEVIIKDAVGMSYRDDYSSGFTDRSLVDKAYVDNALIGATNIYNSDGTLSSRRVVDTDGLDLFMGDFDDASTAQYLAAKEVGLILDVDDGLVGLNNVSAAGNGSTIHAYSDFGFDVNIQNATGAGSMYNTGEEISFSISPVTGGDVVFQTGRLTDSGVFGNTIASNSSPQTDDFTAGISISYSDTIQQYSSILVTEQGSGPQVSHGFSVGKRRADLGQDPSKEYAFRQVAVGPAWFYDWIRVKINETKTDTTGNNVSFYNNSYQFPNEIPAAGAKRLIAWDGGDTPTFEEYNTLLKASATLDFPNTASNAVSDLTITVTGAALSDVVSLGVPNGSIVNNGHFMAWVSAADTVTVRFFGNSVGGNPASGIFKVTVSK